MHPNQILLQDFYAAFQRGDHEAMANAYSDDARFSDPVFPSLGAEDARAMWRMFCTSGNDIEVSFGDVSASDTEGSARWEAAYLFPKTKRRVHNKIGARFEFRDGKIVRHRDDFDLYRWTRMALGPVGVAFGWTPMIQNQVRKQAAAQLIRFRKGESSGSES